MIKNKLISIFTAIVIFAGVGQVGALAKSAETKHVDLRDFEAGGVYTKILGGRSQIGHTVRNGGNGKAAGDTYVQIIAQTPANDTRFSIYNDAGNAKVQLNNMTKPMLFSVDIYDNGAVKEYMFQTNGKLMIADKVTADMLDDNTWNTVSMIFYPSDKHSDVYINGAFKFSYAQNPTWVSNPTVYGTEIRFAFTYDNYESNPNLFIDNVKVYEFDSVTPPQISSDEYRIGDGSISGCAGTAWSEVKQKLIASEGAALSAANTNGAELTDNDIVSAGSIISAKLDLDGVILHKEATVLPYAILATADGDNTAKIGSKVGFSAVVSESGGIGGKQNGDTYIKMQCGAKETRFTLLDDNNVEYNCNAANGTLLYGFDIFPNEAVETIRFTSTGGGARSYEIDASKLKEGAWNQVLLTYDIEEGGRWWGDIYINGHLEYANYTNYNSTSSNAPLRVTIKLKDSDSKNTYYLDNITIADMNEFVSPEFNSTPSVTVRTMNIGNGRIDGFGGLTVSELKGFLSVKEKASYVIYNKDGTEAAEDAELKRDMYVIVNTDYTDSIYKFMRNTYTYKYVFVCPYFEMGRFKCTIDDAEITDNKYTAGKLDISLPIYTYKGETSGVIILAEFNGEQLVKVHSVTGFENYVLDGIVKIPSITIDEGTASIFKVFVWDYDSLMPYTEALNLTKAE